MYAFNAGAVTPTRPMLPTDTRGILAPSAALAQVAFDGVAPCAALGPFVERIFTVRWRLAEPLAQELLPCPCAYWILGTLRPGVHGATTRRVAVELVGEGWVVGVRFRPGGLRSLSGGSMVSLRDRVEDCGAVFGEGARALERSVDAPTSAHIERVQAHLAALRPRPHEAGETVNRAVELARSPAAPTSVQELARALGVSVRVLELRFRDALGMSPKAMLRRCRAIALTDSIARATCSPWAELAAAWGFADQSHLIRDFKRQVGTTPARYAERCAPPTDGEAPR